MTYPSGTGSSTNNAGPYFTPGASQTPVNSSPVPAPAAAANVAASVPSPSTWEFANSELAAQNRTAQLATAQNDGVAFDQSDPPTPTVPGYTTTETKPSAPSGTFAQSGTPYVTNSKAVTLSFGGQDPSHIQYYSGV